METLSQFFCIRGCIALTGKGKNATIITMEQELLAQKGEEQRNMKQSFTQKLGAFFDRNYAMFFAPLIVIVAYMAALFSYGVYPFGDKYTAASYDLSAQICPFIEHFFDVINGRSSLFYSYAVAGGADVLGSLLYCFVSPFSFVFLLLGEGMVAHASSIVMALKLGAISVAGTWFAKKLFKDIPDYLCIAIGIVYTYSGYTFVANTYINWLDLMVYLPFAVGAFKRFVQTGSFWLFSALVACCIYTTFSIACFSMFIAFPSLVFFGLFCVEKENRNRYISRLCLAFVSAVLMALPILLPALASYLNAGRGSGGFFDNFWYGFTLTESGAVTDFADTTFVEKAQEAAYRKWSYVLTDGIFVALTVVWFFRKGLKAPFAKFMLTAGVLTLVPVAVDESMLLLNMGSYMSYAYRFGFLNELFFLGGACLALDNLCWKFDRAYNGELLQPALFVEVENPIETQNEGGRYALKAKLRGSLGWVLGFAAATVAVFAFLVWFIANDHYKTIWESFVSDSEMKKGLSSFSSRFAHSLGGAEVVSVFFVAICLLVLFASLLVKKKKIGLKLASWLLILVVGAQALFLNNQIVVGNRSTQHTGLENYRLLCEQMAVLDSQNERDFQYNNGYFRVKDYSDKVSANAPFTGRSNAYTVFSSMLDADNFTVGELFAYRGNLKNSIKGQHNPNKYNRGEVFGDSFMGYKYFYVPKADRDDIEKDSEMKQYVRKVMVQNDNGEWKHLNRGGYYVYENTLVFPSAYKLPRGDYRFVAPNEPNSGYRKQNQGAFYKFLSGKELANNKVTVSAIRSLSTQLWANAARIEVGAGQITARVSAKKGECLFLNFVASEGYRVYVNGKETQLIDNDIHFLAVELQEGDNVVEFKYSSPYVKWIVAGTTIGLLGLFALALILKKTKIADRIAPVLSWAGIGITVVAVAFFMIFPTATGVVKLVRLIL